MEAVGVDIFHLRGPCLSIVDGSGPGAAGGEFCFINSSLMPLRLSVTDKEQSKSALCPYAFALELKAVNSLCSNASHYA